MTTEWGRDRPIGVRPFYSRWSFAPQFILLTYEAAMSTATGASSGFGYAVIYSERPGLGLDGDYTLFVNVEQIP